MNSILKIFFRQTEDLLLLTKRMVAIFQLQMNLKRNDIDFSDIQDKNQCIFSYDLSNEVRSLQQRLHSTCFLLQRALYRIQALRQTHENLSIQIDDDLIFNYKQNIVQYLNNIQQKILLIISQHNINDSPLNTLPILFKRIQDNFEIVLDYSYRMPNHKSTLYLGSLVSNTLDKFYLILDSLIQLVKDIEEFERK